MSKRENLKREPEPETRTPELETRTPEATTPDI